MYKQTNQLILEETPNLLTPVEHLLNVPNHLKNVRVVCESKNGISLFNYDDDRNEGDKIEIWGFCFEKKCWIKLDLFRSDRYDEDFAVAKLDNQVLLMFKNKSQCNIEVCFCNMGMDIKEQIN